MRLVPTLHTSGAVIRTGVLLVAASRALAWILVGRIGLAGAFVLLLAPIGFTLLVAQE